MASSRKRFGTAYIYGTAILMMEKAREAKGEK